MREDPLVTDYMRAFDTPEGQRVLADLMTVCGVYDVVVESDPMRLALLTGARNVALHIAKKLNATPEDFVKRAKGDEEVLSRVYDWEQS